MTHRIWVGGDATDPNKYDKAANWQPNDDYPKTNDEVTIGPGSISILEGLNQSTQEYMGFHVAAGYTGDIEPPGDALSFKLKTDDLTFAGSGTAFLTVEPDGVSITKVNPVVSQCGRGQTGIPGLTLTGTSYETLAFDGSGSLGIGTAPEDTTSRMDKAVVSGGGTLQVGADIQKMAGGGPDITVAHASATVVADCDVGAAEVQKGIYRQREGKWTAGTVSQGTVYASGSGAHTTTKVDAGGTVHVDANPGARTFTDVEIQNGGIWADPAGTGSYTNHVEFPTGMDSCTLDFGRKKKLLVANM